MTTETTQQPEQPCDFVYVFTLWLEKQLSGFPAVNEDMRKLVPFIGQDGAFHITEPVVSLIFKFGHQLDDEELSGLMLGMQNSLNKRKIEYKKIDITHASREPRVTEAQNDSGGEPSSDQLDVHVGSIQEGHGSISASPDPVD